MHGLDLRSLEIFRTVAVEGSVTKAAMKLNRVQSNISTRIKQLEQHLEKNLFLRQNRGLTLTPDGHLLLSYAERLLQLSMETLEALNEGKPSGVFRIGTMESTAAARLPEILSRYHRLYPDVEIELETDTAGGLMDRLFNYDVEIAFAAEPVSFETISTQAVFEEELVLVVPQSFPPLENTSEISGKTVVAFEPGAPIAGILRNGCWNPELFRAASSPWVPTLPFSLASQPERASPSFPNAFWIPYHRKGSFDFTRCRTTSLE